MSTAAGCETTDTDGTSSGASAPTAAFTGSSATPPTGAPLTRSADVDAGAEDAKKMKSAAKEAKRTLITAVRRPGDAGGSGAER